MNDSYLERGAWLAAILVGAVLLWRLLKGKKCGCHGKSAAMSPTPGNASSSMGGGRSTCGFGGKAGGW